MADSGALPHQSHPAGRIDLGPVEPYVTTIRAGGNRTVTIVADAGDLRVTMLPENLDELIEDLKAANGDG
jgi:hypothetical protein